MLKTKSLFKCSALALAFLVAASAVAEAQQRGGGRGFGGRGFGGPGFGGPGGADKVSLLGNPQVQTELKIVPEQKLFLDDIIAEHREKQREIFSGVDFRTLRDKPEAEREKLMADMQAKREKLNKDEEAGLQEFLSEEQITRLDQIALQLRGLRALTDDEVGKKLAITAEQKKKIEDAFEAGNEARRKMFEDMRGNRDGGNRDGGNRDGGNRDGGNRDGGDQQGGRRGGRGGFDPAAFAEIQKKMEEANKKTDASVLAVLSADQKTKYEALKGKPFELERRGFGGPGGFGGRPGGGRPPGDGGGRPQRPAAE
jgi:Spy/CpxP family protein refolding chaperone